MNNSRKLLHFPYTPVRAHVSLENDDEEKEKKETKKKERERIDSKKKL